MPEHYVFQPKQIKAQEQMLKLQLFAYKLGWNSYFDPLGEKYGSVLQNLPKNGGHSCTGMK